jgi:hypothetical protein
MSDITMRPDLSKPMTQGLNNSYLNNNIAPGSFRTPDYFVYIYSVSNKELVRCIPPMIPRLILKACPADAEYVECARLAEPYEQADRDVDTGEVRMRFHNAKKVAQDIVCPDAPDMDSAVPPESMSSGTDYRAQGVFWSLNNPPLPEEVKKARKRVEKYYRSLLERAATLEYTNPKELAERINEDYHLAADYFGEEYSWHKQRVRKVTAATKVPCPICGDEIKPGVAFHKDSEGEYCILDWKRAYESGRVTLKQVPENKRWAELTPQAETSADGELQAATGRLPGNLYSSPRGVRTKCPQ